MPMPKGFKHSDVTKLKMSLARIGNTNSLGYKHSDEFKKKLSQIFKGENSPNFGSHRSDESKLKMSLLKIGKYDGENNPRWNGGRLKNAQGYILIYKPEHPFATKHGYIFEHRLVMEQFLSRYLTKIEVVHHDGEKDDNRIEMLRLFKNGSEHKKYHNELKINYPLTIVDNR